CLSFFRLRTLRLLRHPSHRRDSLQTNNKGFCIGFTLFFLLSQCRFSRYLVPSDCPKAKRAHPPVSFFPLAVQQAVASVPPISSLCFGFFHTTASFRSQNGDKWKLGRKGTRLGLL